MLPVALGTIVFVVNAGRRPKRQWAAVGLRQTVGQDFADLVPEGAPTHRAPPGAKLAAWIRALVDRSRANCANVQPESNEAFLNKSAKSQSSTITKSNLLMARPVTT